MKVQTEKTTSYIFVFFAVVITIVLIIAGVIRSNNEVLYFMESLSPNMTSISANHTKHKHNNIRILKPKYLDYDMIILFYSTIYGSVGKRSTWKDWFKDYYCNITNKLNNKTYLNRKILLTDDKKLVQYSAGLVFNAIDVSFTNKHIVNLENQLKKLHDNMDYILILYSHETPQYAPAMADDKLSYQYNLLMSYQYNSDIPVPWRTRSIQYQNFYKYETFLSFQDKTKLRNDTLLVWISSNCDAPNGRVNYLRELFKEIKTDSYGKCLNSFNGKRNWPRSKSKSMPISELISQYKFFPVIENSNCNGFITEKLNKAISSGTIPIIFSYNNTPNYDLFLPNHSYINAADFKSVKELAEFLKLVGSDENMYNEYFKYKKDDGIYKTTMDIYPFNQYEDNEFETQWCRAANVIYNYQISKFFNQSYARHIDSDKSCLTKKFLEQYI